jgi:predicted ribosomally synthesized peptide with SipW-like signal peptide
MNESAMDAGRKNEERGLRSRKVRAILAGGLVLGLGAAVTLAAWNDSEFAKGTFTGGSFNIEGSTNGTTFSEHPASGSAADLGFTLDTGDLSPGEVVSAPFAVRVDSESTNGAAVTVSGAATGAVTGLTYRLVQRSEFGCTEGTEVKELVPAGTAVNAVAGTPTFDLAVGAGADPGAAAFVCFTVTTDDDLVQDQTGTATWQFLAASK